MREQNEAESSGSTAQFRAFVDRSGGPEATQAWSMHAQRNRTKTYAAIGVGVAIVVILIAVFAIG
jgi:hypothetical protein